MLPPPPFPPAHPRCSGRSDGAARGGEHWSLGGAGSGPVSLRRCGGLVGRGRAWGDRARGAGRWAGTGAAREGAQVTQAGLRTCSAGLPGGVGHGVRSKAFPLSLVRLESGSSRVCDASPVLLRGPGPFVELLLAGGVRDAVLTACRGSPSRKPWLGVRRQEDTASSSWTPDTARRWPWRPGPCGTVVAWAHLF